MKNKNTLKTDNEKLDIEAERSLLAAIQESHAQVLDEAGLTYKAKILQEVNDSRQRVAGAYVILPGQLQEDGRDVYRPCIRLDIRQTNTRGNEEMIYRDQPVAEIRDGIVFPVEDFTGDEAHGVIDMIHGLYEAKERGLLRHLSDDYSRINPDQPLPPLNTQ